MVKRIITKREATITVGAVRCSEGREFRSGVTVSFSGVDNFAACIDRSSSLATIPSSMDPCRTSDAFEGFRIDSEIHV
jgi:hypothetical protein